MEKIITKADKKEDENNYEFALLTLHLLFSKSIKVDINYSKPSTEYLEFLDKKIKYSINRNVDEDVDKFIFPETVFDNIEVLIGYFEHFVPMFEKKLDKFIESDPEMYEKYLGMINYIKKCCPDIRKNMKIIKSTKEHSKIKNNAIYEIEFNRRYTELSDFSSSIQGVSKDHLEESMYNDYIVYKAIVNNEDLVKFIQNDLFIESLNKLLHDYPSLFFDKEIKKNILNVLKQNILVYTKEVASKSNKKTDKDSNKDLARRSNSLVNKLELLKDDYTNLPFDVYKYNTILAGLFYKKVLDNKSDKSDKMLDSDYYIGLFEDYLSQNPNNPILGKDFKINEFLSKNIFKDRDFALYISEAKTKYNPLKLVKTLPIIVLDNLNIPLPVMIKDLIKESSYKEDIHSSMGYDFELVNSLSCSREEFNELLENGFFESDNFIYTIKLILKDYPFLLKDLQVSSRLTDAIAIRENKSEKKYVKEIETYSKKSNC